MRAGMHWPVTDGLALGRALKAGERAAFESLAVSQSRGGLFGQVATGEHTA